MADAARGAVLGLVLVTCLATSAPPPRPPRPFIAWSLDRSTPVVAGCLRARGWVSKSGKTGVGVTLRLENTSGVPCSVAAVDARFQIGEGGPALAPILPLVLLDDRNQAAPLGAIPACQVRFVYLGFRFDGAATWRAGLLNGAFTARVTVGGADVTLASPARQGAVQLPGPGGVGALPEPPPSDVPACTPAAEPAP